MSHGPDLEHLAAQWADQPDGLAFAALAEGLRKRGSHAEALAIVAAGLEHHPRHLPAFMVLSRVHADEGRLDDAEGALREALRLDPAHPGVLDALADVADRRGDIASGRAWREALAAALPDPVAGPDDEIDTGADALEDDGPELLSESLAALYARQGHLDRAHQVYAALAARDPGNDLLASRRDALGAEIATRRPLPYDARLSGGVALRDWLAAIAAADAEPLPARAGYDAFFQPEAAPVDETADIEAFQSWLKGLPR